MSFPKFRITLVSLYVFCSTIAHSQNDLSLAGKDLTRDFVTKDTLFKSPYIDKTNGATNLFAIVMFMEVLPEQKRVSLFIFHQKKNIRDAFINTSLLFLIMKIYRKVLPDQKIKLDFLSAVARIL